MKSAPARFGTTIRNRRIFSWLVLSLLTISLHADQVQMQNGDRYFGKITALNTNSLILQSDVLGIVQLPRNKVATILLGTNVVSNIPSSNNVPALANATATRNTAPETASLRQLAAHTNLIQQVQSRYLADAGPEANAKFTELMTGLTTGKLSVNDLRAEAKKSVDQVRELKRGLGEDESSSLDVYLSILDKFLKETPAPTGSPVVPAAPKSPIKPDKDDE
ncbi:MAG: hypothetical protein ABIP71_05175 [Verrucomicrobiota bacterium]